MVIRSPERLYNNEQFLQEIIEEKPTFVLMAQLTISGDGFKLLKNIKKLGIPTVSWSYDIYWDYFREPLIKNTPFFYTDICLTTDGGHQKDFKKMGINHQVLRQGIPDEYYYKAKAQKDIDVLFVGGENHRNPYRQKLMAHLTKYNLQWIGKHNTNECRGHELNKLIARAKIIIGESVFSPYYWSNRVYETCGRGGFFVHNSVEGLQKEFPDLITYERGNFQQLDEIIEYYLKNDEERDEIAEKCFKKMKDYLISKRCKTLEQLITGIIE